MTAFGTVGAVVVALGLGLLELWRQRRAADERRRDQAQCVAAWREVFVSGPGDESDVFSVRTHAANTSAMPVYGVSFRYPAFDSRNGEWLDLRWHEVALLPGQHVETDWEEQPGNPGGGKPVTVTFRDARGVWWVRDEVGDLSELPGDPDGHQPAQPTPRPRWWRRRH